MKTKAIIFLAVAVLALGFSSCSKLDPLTGVNKSEGEDVTRGKGTDNTLGTVNSGSNGSGSGQGGKERLEEEITDPGGGDDDEKPASSAQ